DHGYPNRQSSWQLARSRPADTPQPTPFTAKRGGSPGRPASVRARQRRPRLPKPTELLAAGRARSRPAIKQSAPRRTHRNTRRKPRPTGVCSNPATATTATQTNRAPGSGPGAESPGTPPAPDTTHSATRRTPPPPPGAPDPAEARRADEK